MRAVVLACLIIVAWCIAMLAGLQPAILATLDLPWAIRATLVLAVVMLSAGDGSPVAGFGSSADMGTAFALATSLFDSVGSGAESSLAIVKGSWLFWSGATALGATGASARSTPVDLSPGSSRGLVSADGSTAWISAAGC